MNSRPTRFCILGISSWIGSLIAERIHDYISNSIISGSVSRSSITLPDSVSMTRVTKPEELLTIIKDNRPDVLFNFLRGETENDFRIHKEMVSYCLKYNCYYVYASSVLSLDGYNEIELTEDLPAKSISSYGIFKARCEETLLNEKGCRSLILRFASIQGWVSHKETRNQIFLEKMKRGERITVDQGVIQNRLFDRFLVEMILQLVQDKVEGVVHLGTIDASSEFDFLKAHAKIFGWSGKNIIPGKSRNVNLFAKPGRIIGLYGDRFNFTEIETLQSLRKLKSLEKYLGPHAEKQ